MRIASSIAASGPLASHEPRPFFLAQHEGIGLPAVAGGHHVQMRVEREHRTGTVLQTRHHIGAARLVFGQGQIETFLLEQFMHELRRFDFASRRILRVDGDEGG
ncbi:hypothetical protein [Candidatus Burkholderia verschuerenii]|uniref:hypothetical protein n=1 Tax=Candidatus Burkholderia verschuerenii TaxID=242163 RepID=UPI0018DD88B8|nr:hypothetical protein [Candidatus Burkholderia verschuerenii]